MLRRIIKILINKLEIVYYILSLSKMIYRVKFLQTQSSYKITDFTVSKESKQ